MSRLPNKYPLLLALLLAFQACAAFAERADRDQPMHIESDQMNLDNSKHISVFEGNVVLTQGTLRVLAEKIVVTEDSTGHKFSVATGHLASFRQKRDGVDEYVEGYGERIEYDTLSEKVDFYVRARVKRDQDDVRGDHITYSTKTEVFSVNSPEKVGRVRATLQPKSKENKVQAKPVASLKPAVNAAVPKSSDALAASAEKASSAVSSTAPDSVTTLPATGETRIIEPAASAPVQVPALPESNVQR